MSNLRQLEVT